MTSKLPWATAAVIIIIAAIGAWALWPTAEVPVTPAVPGAWSSISVVGIPAGSKSGIVAIYIAKPGQDYDENWSAVATTDNYYAKFTGSEQVENIPYETPFVFLIEVVGHKDNMAYVNMDNLKVEFSVTSGSFTKAAENTNGGDGQEFQFAITPGTEIGVNAVWDNNGDNFKLPGGGSINWTARLYLWS